MPLHPIPNTDLKVSPLCYGVMRFGCEVHGQEMHELYRVFCESGGNFFDTAHCYSCWYPNGDGCSERSLGECIAKFGNRKEVVVSTKGGLFDMGKNYPRPDDCMTPEVIASDISESLERLQIDQIDLYTLHRDDPNHPAEEIVETLNAEIKRGRIRYIGASNWTTERIAAANAHAAARGLQGFVAASPQWNLGRPNHPSIGWDGSHDQTTHLMTEADILWHRQTQVAVMPWTPTAYGFFDGLESPNAMSFDNPDSRARRDRAAQLGKELGASTSQIAMAYLLAHDFPVFPIIGTTNLARLKESLAAADITLTPKQRDWLLNG